MKVIIRLQMYPDKPDGHFASACRTFELHALPTVGMSVFFEITSVEGEEWGGAPVGKVVDVDLWLNGYGEHLGPAYVVTVEDRDMKLDAEDFIPSLADFKYSGWTFDSLHGVSESDVHANIAQRLSVMDEARKKVVV